jgi:uncharacterized membrane protein
MLAASAFCSAAVIRGTVYDWSTLEPAKDVVVTINTTPAQRMVAVDGSYSFNVPKGSFILEARQTKGGGEEAAVAQENVTVADEGSYSIDLITWPIEGTMPTMLEDNASEVPELDIANLTAMLEQKPEPQPAQQWLQAVGFAIAALAGAAVIWMLMRNMKREAEKTEEKPASGEARGGEPEVRVKKTSEPLSQGPSAEESEVMQRLSESGGSIGQKDLRKALHVSEAKASMLVSELERKGLVKKIKKGRGNLVKIV